MAKVAIVTDSNSGITTEMGERLGLTVVPMPVEIDGTVFYEGKDLGQEQFYERLLGGADIATSQPAPAELMDTWERVLKTHDALVYIPMSGGLSSSCQTAAALAGDYGGRVQVADNRRISVTQRCSVMDALRMAEEGLSASEIRQTLERQKDDACIYITVDTLKYLRKGGRVSGLEAVAGTMLSIKPVMEIRGEKLAVVTKARGMRSARKQMIQRLRADIQGRLKPLRDAGHLAVSIAYSQVSDAVKADWWSEVQAAFPEETMVEGDPLTLSIACHTGPGALGIGAVRV